MQTGGYARPIRHVTNSHTDCQKPKDIMIGKIQALQQEVNGLQAATEQEWEALRIKYLSKKGEVTALMNDFRSVPADQKRVVGQAINELKTFATDKINALRDGLESAGNQDDSLDLTRTASPLRLGSRHPLSLVRE